MVAVAITRDGHDAASLRRAASSIRDADAARRMLTLALILDGRPRSEAAALCGMERQTLRDWVHRYNAEGLAGLSDRRDAVGPRHRRRLLLKARRDVPVQPVLRDWVSRVDLPNSVRVQIDVDPVGFM
ncbi:MAG: helix-turn-helix domain-containing protein [Roseomonas sp.]|nr:helix-turn-helix domain-containing protein [Roseomonas sp.]